MMKKTRTLLAMLSIFCLLALCAGMIGCNGIFTQNETTPATTPNETPPNETTPSFGEGYTVVEGRIVKTNNGYFILPDDSSPAYVLDYAFIKLRTTFAQISLSNLQTGNRIKIAIQTIMDSYPAQTEVYQLAFIESGSIDSIPENIITELGNLNYTVVE